jgi:uncharacterized lipoprotein YbaY
MPDARTVRGEIVLPVTGVTAQRGDVIVTVEDVSRADAPAQVVAQTRQPGVALGGGATLPFEVEVPASLIDERRSYAVRVHIDTTGSGQVERGDLISTESYPILTRSYGTDVRIRVRPV